MSTEIRALMNEHYGMEMPVIVLKMEDEIRCYQSEHREVPPLLWEYVNHKVRLVREWTYITPVIDLVVKQNGEYKLVQDVCFKDAFNGEDEWRVAVLDLLKSTADVWVVKHVD